MMKSETSSEERAELRRLYTEAGPGESATLIPAMLDAFPRLLNDLDEMQEQWHNTLGDLDALYEEIACLKDPRRVLLDDGEVVATINEIASAKKLKAEVARQTAYLRQLLDYNHSPVVTIHKQMLLQAIIEPLENASNGKP